VIVALRPFALRRLIGITAPAIAAQARRSSAKSARWLGVEVQLAEQSREGNLGIAADSDRRMRPHAALAAGNDKAIPRKDRLGFAGSVPSFCCRLQELQVVRVELIVANNRRTGLT